MAGWHHRLEGREFEQALGDGEGQGSLACCTPRGHKEPDATERLNSSSWLHFVYFTVSAPISFSLYFSISPSLLSFFIDVLSQAFSKHSRKASV